MKNNGKQEERKRKEKLSNNFATGCENFREPGNGKKIVVVNFHDLLKKKTCFRLLKCEIIFKI